MFYETVGALKKALEGISDDVGIAIPSVGVEYEEIKSVELHEMYYDGSRYYDNDFMEDLEEGEKSEMLEDGKREVIIIE